MFIDINLKITLLIHVLLNQQLKTKESKAVIQK